MRSRKTLISLVVCLSVVLSLLLSAVVVMDRTGWFAPDTTAPTQLEVPTGTSTHSTHSTTGTTQTVLPTTSSTTQPTDPPVYKVGTATISSVGDFLMHMPVVNSADRTDGEYDFANAFTYFRDYVSAADYAVGNLETTLAGADYAYSGYPQFNCPDGIVPSLQAAGFDMLLTANNHSYDTYKHGFYRTQELIRSFEMDYLGTVDSREAPRWQVHEINGIRIGMVCYTYENSDNLDIVNTNANLVMDSETAPLMCTFSYGQLEVFYGEMQQHIADMEAAGAEAIMLYIHWGNEYQTKQNATQSAMAQKLCDLGVDVIVGGHPHVVQPMELLTSTTDENHKTVCLYSTGNIISNQRKELMNLKTGHTEDGVMFSVTFAKYSDGTVILEAVDLLPTWVDLHLNAQTGKNVYAILPLDQTLENWQECFGLTDSRHEQALASYQRTMAIVSQGLAQTQAYLAQLVADTEAALGVVG